jgi:hypothetical protein
MLKKIGLNPLFYFLYMFGCCVIVMLGEALFISVVEKFVELPYPVLTVIRIVIYTAGVPAILAVLGRGEGYREGACSVVGTILSGLLAMILHLLFSMLFHFQGFVSGGVRFTAGLIHNGWDITYDSLINVTPYYMFLLTFAGYGLIYVTVLTLSKLLGAQKRVVDRGELRKGENERSDFTPDDSLS